MCDQSTRFVLGNVDDLRIRAQLGQSLVEDTRDGPFAQIRFEHLANGGLRQLIQNFDMLWLCCPFLDVLGCEIHQFICRHRGARYELYIDTRDFTRIGVGLSDCTGHRNGRVAGQGLFDVGGIDVMAAANDQVLGAPCDPDVTIAIDPAQVARPQMCAVGIKAFVLGRLGIGVACPYARCGHTDFSDFIDVADLVDGAILIAMQDLNVRIGEGDANRADFLLTVDRVATHKAGRFRQTISFNDVDRRFTFKALEQFDRQGRRAGERGLHS